MPRKQRFKPSRKPKPVETVTHLATPQVLDPASSQEPDTRILRDFEARPPAFDAGGETG